MDTITAAPVRQRRFADVEDDLRQSGLRRQDKIGCEERGGVVGFEEAGDQLYPGRYRSKRRIEGPLRCREPRDDVAGLREGRRRRVARIEHHVADVATSDVEVERIPHVGIEPGVQAVAVRGGILADLRSGSGERGTARRREYWSD